MRNDNKLAVQLTQKLNKMGISGTISPSPRKNKRFVFFTTGAKPIHFGDPRATTFADGASEKKRKSYRARASKIKNKAGEFTYNKRITANFLAYHLLW
jgi:hypothetical protein